MRASGHEYAVNSVFGRRESGRASDRCSGVVASSASLPGRQRSTACVAGHQGVVPAPRHRDRLRTSRHRRTSLMRPACRARVRIPVRTPARHQAAVPEVLVVDGPGAETRHGLGHVDRHVRPAQIPVAPVKHVLRQPLPAQRAGVGAHAILVERVHPLSLRAARPCQRFLERPVGPRQHPHVAFLARRTAALGHRPRRSRIGCIDRGSERHDRHHHAPRRRLARVPHDRGDLSHGRLQGVQLDDARTRHLAGDLERHRAGQIQCDGDFVARGVESDIDRLRYLLGGIGTGPPEPREGVRSLHSHGRFPGGCVEINAHLVEVEARQEALHELAHALLDGGIPGAARQAEQRARGRDGGTHGSAQFLPLGFAPRVVRHDRADSRQQTDRQPTADQHRAAVGGTEQRAQ